MITRMSNKYENELVEFLYKYNNEKEYSVAWVPENYAEICSYDKSNFYIAIENDEIVGAFGTHISIEQKLVRLLGPIIDKRYFEKYVDQLYKLSMKELPEGMKELRIAFFLDNECCNKWCEANDFELYNAEKTMIYDKALFKGLELSTTVKLIDYNANYKEGLAQVHPKGVFFTLDELISEISNKHKLILAIDKDEVVGYIYYEIAENLEKGEVVLLHVKENNRGKGHGTILLQHTIKRMIKEEVKEISTSVRVTNYGAQKLYERVGFREFETIYAYKKQI